MTDYNLHKGCCNKCGKKFKAELPKGVTNDMCGPNLKVLIATLTGFYNKTKREAQRFLKDIYGIRVSLGTIKSVEKFVSKCLKEFYESLKQSFEKAKLAHFDETTYKKIEKRMYAWLASCDDAVLIKFADTRGQKVLEDFFYFFSGICISDRYAAYNFFGRENRAVCWAHLIRNFERFVTSSFENVSELGTQIKELGYQLFTLRDDFESQKISLKIFQKKASEVQSKMLILLQKMTQNKPTHLRLKDKPIN